MVEYSFSIPDEEEYNRLRSLVGWEKITSRQYDMAVLNAVSVSARLDKELVGFARSITDKGALSFIVDVMVDPAVQGRGIGSELVKMLISKHQDWLIEDEVGYVSILSTKGKEPFYKKQGFVERPNTVLGAGMTKRLRSSR